VNVTVTNAGAGASNALLFTFQDTTAPTLKQLNAAGGTSTVEVVFSETVCLNADYTAADWVVTVNGNGNTVTTVQRAQGTDLTSSTATTLCNGTKTPTPSPRGGTAASTATSFSAVELGLTTPITQGDFITVTATCNTASPPDALSPCSQISPSAAGKTQDLAGNVMQSAQTVTGTAIGDTTKPSISSTTTVDSTNIRLTYSEPVTCNNSAAAAAQFTITTAGTSFAATSISCVTTSSGATRVTLTTAPTQDVSAGGFVTYVEDATIAANRIHDLAGNNAVSPQTISFSAIAAATPPVITDAHVTNNIGSTDWGDSTSDAFSLTFNEAMNTTTAGVSIQVSDNDPTTVKTSATLSCGSGAGTVTCVWNTAATVLTVTSNGGLSVSSPTGTTPGLQLPLTITATTGLKDTDDGVAPNLSASDKTID